LERNISSVIVANSILPNLFLSGTTSELASRVTDKNLLSELQRIATTTTTKE